MSAHPPGPWTVSGISMNDGSISIGAEKYRIVIACVTNAASFGDMLVGAIKRAERGKDDGRFYPSDAKTQFANARLIAASPDLLAACKRIKEAIFEGRMTVADHEALDAAIAKTEAST